MEPLALAGPLGPAWDFDLVDDLAEYELGVADDGEVDGVFGVDVGGVVGGLNHDLASGDGGGGEGLLEAGADAEDEVALGEEVVDHAGLGVAACAEGEGMVFGEAALAEGGGHDGGLQKLGEFDEFAGGLGVEAALASINQGELGP